MVGTEKTFDLQADNCHLAALRTDLRTLLEKGGFDDKATNDVLLAVQEVVTNVIRHTYKGKEGQFQVSYKEDADQIEVIVRDYGEKFDITQVPDPKLPKETPGGLGIFLVKKLMDQVTYDSDCDQGNKVHLIKYKTKK